MTHLNSKQIIFLMLWILLELVFKSLYEEAFAKYYFIIENRLFSCIKHLKQFLLCPPLLDLFHLSFPSNALLLYYPSEQNSYILTNNNI